MKKFLLLAIVIALGIASGFFAHWVYTKDNVSATNTIPTSVAFFETSLASAITSSATSMTLVSGLDKAGTALASSTYGFVIDEGTASEEIVLADCTSTACTNMTRGISVVTGSTTVASLQKSHRRGASVKITDGPSLMILSRIANGIGSYPNLLSYTSGTGCNSGSSGSAICDATYVRNLANADAATSTETIGGIVELATALEQASSTYNGVDQPTVLQSRYATSSPGGTAAALYTLILDNAGKIAQAAINLAITYTWTALHTFSAGLTSSATTTIAASSVTNNALVLNTVAYQLPGSQGSADTFLKNNGSGVLTWGTPTLLRYTYATTTSHSLSGATATSTGFFTVPAGTITASSTIRFQGYVSECNNSSGGGNCSVAFRTSTGATFATITTGVTDAGENSGTGVFDITVYGNNSTSAQRTVGNSFCVNPGSPSVGVCGGLVTTSSIDLSGAITFAVVMTAPANTTMTLVGYSIEVNQ